MWQQTSATKLSTGTCSSPDGRLCSLVDAEIAMQTSQQEPQSRERLDNRILEQSPIALYFKLTVLQADVAWFTSHGYQVRTARAGVAASAEALLHTLGQLLSLPEPAGAHLDAFSDCLNRMEIPEPGLVLVLEDFGTFAAAFRRQAQALLHACACQSRRLLLTGRRFIVLAHSKDPKVQFEPVGATPVPWNPQEGPNAARGL